MHSLSTWADYQKKDWWDPAHQSFFCRDNGKDLKIHGFAAHTIIKAWKCYWSTIVDTGFMTKHKISLLSWQNVPRSFEQWIKGACSNLCTYHVIQLMKKSFDWLWSIIIKTSNIYGYMNDGLAINHIAPKSANFDPLLHSKKWTLDLGVINYLFQRTDQSQENGNKLLVCDMLTENKSISLIWRNISHFCKVTHVTSTIGRRYIY